MPKTKIQKSKFIYVSINIYQEFLSILIKEKKEEKGGIYLINMLDVFGVQGASFVIFSFFCGETNGAEINDFGKWKQLVYLQVFVKCLAS